MVRPDPRRRRWMSCVGALAACGRGRDGSGMNLGCHLMTRDATAVQDSWKEAPIASCFKLVVRQSFSCSLLIKKVLVTSRLPNCTLIPLTTKSQLRTGCREVEMAHRLRSFLEDSTLCNTSTGIDSCVTQLRAAMRSDWAVSPRPVTEGAICRYHGGLMVLANGSVLLLSPTRTLIHVYPIACHGGHLQLGGWV
jgi:hypothetical protein